MTDTSDRQAQLDRAYELIQQEREEEALDILAPLIEADPADADAWWLASYAVTDPKEARLALVNVLKNNPHHEKARDILTQLNEYDPPTAEELAMLKEVPAPDGSLRDMPLPEGAEFGDLDDEDLFGDLLAEAEEPERRGLPRPFQIAMVITMIAIVVLLGVALLSERQTDEADQGRSDLAALEQGEAVDALAGLDLGENRQPVFSQTALGQTLFVETCVCVTPNCDGPSPQRLPEVVLDAIQTAAAEVVQAEATEDVAGLGVNVVACQVGDGDDLDTLYRVFVPMEAVRDYENLTLETLQASWTVEE